MNLLMMIHEEYSNRTIKIWTAFLIYGLFKTTLWWQGYFAKFFHGTKYASFILAVLASDLAYYDFTLKIQKNNLYSELNAFTKINEENNLIIRH